MSAIPTEQLLAQLHWRYATKQYDSGRAVSPGDLAALKNAVVLTASSFGLQPWKALFITDKATREKLLAASWGQRQITDASQLVVFAIKKDLGEAEVDQFIARVGEVRGVPIDSLAGFRGMLVGAVVQGKDAKSRNDWAARQAYIALGNLLTSAALLGIDAGPMEEFAPDNYDEILGFGAQGSSTVVVCTPGYRSAGVKYESAQKVRFSLEQVIEEI